MTAIIYTGPSCGPCIGTKSAFKARGVPFEERPASDHLEELSAMQRKHGLSSALPYVVAGDEVWNGFQPARIGDLAARMQTDG